MTVWPGFGRFEVWVRLLNPQVIAPTTYSMLGGILRMIDHGNAAIGLLLLCFSVLFPTLKLAMLAFATSRLRAADNHQPRFGWLHHTGKLSMLDVMVLALVVIAIEGLPGPARVSLEWGVGSFAASVILALIASIIVSSHKTSSPWPTHQSDDNNPAAGLESK